MMADFEKRRESILSQVKKLEQKHGFEVELEDRLLTEVTNLVEWPTVLLGDFEKDFLELPSEVLVTSMAVHQRYFPVFQKNEDNKTTPTHSDNNIRSSAGFGIKFYSFIGPIAFTWGFPIQDESYDIKRMFTFSLDNIN